MQAMPMINQPAVVNEAVAPRATRSSSSKSDDGFLPALREACSESGDNELAGAAMAEQNVGSQEDLAENNGMVPPQASQREATVFVATEDVIANAATSIAGPVDSKTVLAADVAVPVVVPEVETATAAEILPDVAVDPVLERGTNSASLPAESIAAVSQRSASMVAKRDQVAPELPQLISAEVEVQNSSVATAPTVVAPVAVTQLTSSEVETQAIQQLNVMPFNRGTVQESGGGTSKKENTGSGTIVTDPRFAALLNRPELGESLRQQQNVTSLNANSVGATIVAAGSEGSSPLNTVLDDGISLSPATDALSNTEAFGTTLPSSQNIDATVSTAIQPEAAKLDGTLAPKAEVTIPLKDGSSLPEGRVVQQTIDHLTLHARGDSSSVTVKLHPEELGELQLRMVMEGDQLKVHLHAQSQQVQEVLERNFPRLRDALQDQGVTVEDFQVSVDSGERGDQQFSQQREFVANVQRDHFSSHDQVDDVEEMASVVGSRVSGSGVSLRV